MISKIEADKLVEKYETFYRKEISIQGCDAKIFVYNYLLADKEAFKDPLARELRGLTIIHENAKEFIYPSIPKFFNINELPETQEKVIKLKTIKKISRKEDGSMIQPVMICGDVKMKTKQSFSNPQAVMAQEIFEDDEELQFFILDCFDNNFFPMFELVGPDNRIVLDYNTNELVLIAVRSSDGGFIDIDKFSYKNKAETFHLTMDEMIHQAKTKKDEEGFVVKFTDESIIKIKTLDYVTKHRMVSETDSNKSILSRILQEEIDDIYPLLSDKKIKEIKEIEKVVSDYTVHYIKQIEQITKAGDNNNRQSFVAEHIKHPYFSVIMSGIKGHKIKETLITYLLKKYNREEKAKKFIKELLS